MAWRFKFEAPVGCRSMKDCFNWVKVYPKSNEQESMWCPTGERFFDTYENTKELMKSDCMQGINSVKAFKRFLRKRGENLKGYEVVLCSRYWIMDGDGKFLYDYSVTAEWHD